MSALIGVRSSCDMLARNSDFSSIRALDFLRLPLQPRVLFGQVGGRLSDALFELAVQALERFIESLVLDLLREIVQHRDDRDRFAAFVPHFSGHDFDRQLDAACADAASDIRSRRAIVVEQRELRR